MTNTGIVLRRGLPRIAGEAAWPPVSAGPAGAATPAAAPMRLRSRRGLPRVAGGEPWPPEVLLWPAEGEAPRHQLAAAGPVASMSDTRGPTGELLSEPIRRTRTAWAGTRDRSTALPDADPVTQRSSARLVLAKRAVLGAVGLTFLAGMAVLASRIVLSTPWGAGFLVQYPGEYHLPEAAPVGVPGWMAWQHFFNAFLMVLIIRSGLQVRTEKRPSVTWSPRWNPQRKISLTIWFHQALDILWLTNGGVFVILLFATGQWMRIVPTSIEAIPNAISAALQYASLDWPTENGWVNYNALQQIAYGLTVFVAAPLAAISGVRMSGIWPAKARRLSRLYPVEWARAVHFPVMLYFVVFIAIHVILVLATGALRNLNHMYAAQGSTDPTAYADNWLGFWLFVCSLAVIAAAWAAARPLVLAPIARLFGSVRRG